MLFNNKKASGDENVKNCSITCLMIFALLFAAVSPSSAQCATLSQSELASLVENFFPSGTTNSGENIQVVAYAVACVESSKRPCVAGDNGASIGLWQINVPSHPECDPNQLTDPSYNAQSAAQISSGGKNWKPWSTWKNGAYEQYIPEAESALGVAPERSIILIGDKVRATTGLNVRTEPGTSGSKITTMAAGSTGTVLEGPVSAEGYTWWKIGYDDGTTGWSADNWLEST